MERGIRLLAIIHLLVIGLSHIFYPGIWTRFFQTLQRHGRVGVFINGFLSLWFGTIVVAFHQVWTGIPLLLTLLGWAQVIKGSLSFLLPQIAERSLALVRPERQRLFLAPGLILTALGLLLGYDFAR